LQGARIDVLVIVLDALRADRIGALGNTRGLTPNIDAFFARAARPVAAFAPAPQTAPSFASLLTGMPPAAHGVRNVDKGGVWVLDEKRTTVFEVLQRAGFATVCVHEGGQVREESGFARGVDHWLATADLAASLLVLERALPNLGDDRPVFCVVHTNAANAPFVPPREQDGLQFRGRFTDDTRGGEFRARAAALEAFEGTRRGKEFADLAQRFLDPFEGASADDAAWLGDLYDENVAYVDHQVGRILALWEQHRDPATSIVVLTSGHGLALGENGAFGAVASIDDATTRVPWAIAGAGFEPGVFDAVVGVTATAPTLLDALDVEPPATMTAALAEEFAARGGVEIVGGFEQQSLARDEWAVAIGKDWARIVGDPAAAVPQLFDLAAAPLESAPNDDTERIAVLRGELERARIVARGTESSAPARQVPLDPKARQKLRVLGYLERP
jgi:arylsulfatase A-like enzyme